MTNLTRQDVQGLIDNARNRIMERVDRVATRQDLQLINDNLRIMITNIQQSQQLLRQSEYQRIQMMRRTVALEARLIQVDQELRSVRAALDKLADSQPEKVLMPVQSPAESKPATTQQGYQYNPA